MKRYISFLLAVLIVSGTLLGATNSVRAQETTPASATPSTGASAGASDATSKDSTGTTGAAAGTAGGNCDFSAIKKSIFGTESGGDCTALCKGGGCSTGAGGKYQFIPSTRSSYIANHPECNGGSCNTDAAWRTNACCGVQECIMNAYLADSQANIKKDPNCQTLLNNGQSYTGSGQGKTMTCKATESGIMGAMHLGGNGTGKGGVCARILNGNGNSSDQLGTSIAYYMCKHGGVATPGNCNGQASPEGTTQPPATQMQIETGQFASTGGPVDPLKEWWVAGLQQMAMQFTVNMVAQVEALGMLFDAKHQLETQRLLQQKMAEAHKDYHPSEQMCTFGTFSRDLAAAERNTRISNLAISNEILQRESGAIGSKGASQISDSMTRMAQFITRFCNPEDHGGGLKNMCPTAAPANMQNRDVNFTATLDAPLTLKIKMEDNVYTEDEEAVFALVDNLFSHNVGTRLSEADMELPQNKYHYMNMRSIIAMRGIARNSMSNLIAMKAESPTKNDSSAPFLKSLMKEFGMQPDEISKFLGDNPSYYAQMEVLTKKMYQNPIFYSKLYDKPANVKRIRAAMQAIKLMQDRDIQEAMQRREMLLSVMLELRLRQKAEDVYDAAESSMYEDN